MRLRAASIRAARLFASGVHGFMDNALLALKRVLVPVGPGVFPPEVVVQVKALACELPLVNGMPLSRWSCADIAGVAVQRGIVAAISGTTIWRWLHEDAIRPWQHRSWIFPRDPSFVEKAGRILDLYERRWQGRHLRDDEYVLSADEKTSIQARVRIHPTRNVRPGHAMRVEHEYERRGAWAYLAALDVHHAIIHGRCEPTTGIAPFERLVEQVMLQDRYREARRVFIIVDNGSSHRGEPSILRMRKQYQKVVLVHGPLHASWLNQIEIYFSIVQRKVLTPNDFQSLDEVRIRLEAFERYFESIAQPFDWTFTRTDLNNWIRKLPNATELGLRSDS
jgi:hypothetical protein